MQETSNRTKSNKKGKKKRKSNNCEEKAGLLEDNQKILAYKW